MKRFSSELGWKAQWTSSVGTVTDFGLQGRGDIYRVTNLTLNDQSHYSGQRARFTQKAHAHVKYPFYRLVKGGRLVIEPIAGVVFTANGRNSVRIPNEDSLLFELSDANILSPNRLTGLDVVDEWSRLNYGAKFAYYSKAVGNSELFFGQSHSLTKVPTYLDETGLHSKRSDYVARANYVYKDWVEIANHLLLSKKNLRAKRNESSITVGQPILKLNAAYTRFPKLSIPGISVEQISYGASSQFTRHWSVTGNITRELGNKGGNLSHGGSLSYEDDCFKFTSSIVKTFYIDRDYKPGVTVMFRLSFKNLGDVQISGDQLGLGQKAVARTEDDDKEKKIIN
jgi:LPS-assembly protein